jgi:LysR family transcriptional regulator, low CO2-responsive transcriptional regulator
MALDSRITLHKLEVFERVVELESVTRAADELLVAQPVVTAHIRSLEERVGAKLFYRDGRQLQLTEAGHAVHGWVVDVLTHTRELSRQLDGLQDGSRGSVAIGSSMSIGSYILPSILAEFRRERPRVQIRLDVLDTDLAIRATEAGETDFAIVFAGREPGRGALLGERIGEERLVLVTAPDAEPRAEVVEIEDLARLAFIDSDREHIRQRLIDQQLRRIGVERRHVAMRLGHPEAMKRAVRDGVGVAVVLQSSVTDELAARTLRRVEIRGARLAIPMYAIRRRRKTLSASQRDLLALVSERVSTRLIAS